MLSPFLKQIWGEGCKAPHRKIHSSGVLSPRPEVRWEAAARLTVSPLSVASPHPCSRGIWSCRGTPGPGIYVPPPAAEQPEKVFISLSLGPVPGTVTSSLAGWREIHEGWELADGHRPDGQNQASRQKRRRLKFTGQLYPAGIFGTELLPRNPRLTLIRPAGS